MAYSNASEDVLIACPLLIALRSFITPTHSAARSFALRARGFRSSSSGWGVIGFFVKMRSGRRLACASARSVCLTIRSSSE